MFGSKVLDEIFLIGAPVVTSVRTLNVDLLGFAGSARLGLAGMTKEGISSLIWHAGSFVMQT